MRDLKHLIYFENLLENADNELVKQAQADGNLAIGYTCYHMPEPLLNVGNCFSVRLRAPRTGSLDIATYYMSNYTCEYARALVERGMEGGYQFLDALAGVDACSMMNRAMEHFEILQMNDKPNFFVTHADIPYKYTDYTLKHYVTQMQNRVLNVMNEKLGVDISEEALDVARENARINGLTNVTFEAHNCFDHLRELTDAGEQFDLVILDPPAFTKNKAALPSALRGYKEINLRGLKLVRPGGFLVTCSCSQHVLPEMFQDMVNQAARDAKKRIRLVEYRTQGKDHPILPQAVETKYLKCMILQVME